MMNLFPNGFGTRALIAISVIGAAVTVGIMTQNTDKLFDLAGMVMVFYFLPKAMNGKPPA